MPVETSYPVLTVEDPATLATFLHAAFGARIVRGGETAADCFGLRFVLRGSDSASGESVPSELWLCVDDVRGRHDMAVASGAESLQEPKGESGAETACVLGPAGTVWWLCAHAGAMPDLIGD